MNHFIALKEAAQMTTLYRNQRNLVVKDAYQQQDLLPLSETFDRTAFDTLLAKNGCTGLRIYYGMSEDLKVHALITAVNAEGADLLTATSFISSAADNATEDVTETDTLEHANRCPDICPPDSPLNTDPAPY